MALIVGNWKMHGLRAALGEVEAMAAGAAARGAELWLAPSFTLIADAARVAAGRLRIGGQDCHEAAEGAHTGCVSAVQLADAGAGFVIVGHSERRLGHGESDRLVRAKARAAQVAGLRVILCVGETHEQRAAGAADAVVAAQLAGSLPEAATGLVVAYEPVWAIGTGRVPTADEVMAIHGVIGERLAARYGEGVPVLYGGSVKPDNAAMLLGLPGVAGALVGGASLTAASLLAIVDAAGAAGA